MPTDYNKILTACPLVERDREYAKMEGEAEAKGNDYSAGQFRLIQKIARWQASEIVIEAQPELSAERDAALAAGNKNAEQQLRQKAFKIAELSCLES
jgi:hypothetical protein